ncbi:Protein NRT1/ PTR FAMILY 8.1 (AtNPF8.1) (Peptide transporter PTR1) [Durusdinium trenchii]
MALAVVCIVVIELCWSVGLNTLVSTMKSWLQDQGFTNADSSSVHQIFTLLSFAFCFLGGLLAETYVGRYTTILVFSAIYAAGCALTAFAATPAMESIPLFMVGILVLTAPGTGGVKPNIGTFGADQFDDLAESGRRKEAFFMYLYVTMSVGAVIAFGFLANVATAGLPGIPKEDGFFCAYMIMAILMAIALLVFIVGTPFYRKESFDKNTEPVLMLTVQRLLGGRQKVLGKVALLGWVLLPTLIILSVLQVFYPSHSLTIVSLLADLLCIGCLCVAHRDNCWLGEPDRVTRCLDVVPKIIVGNVTFNVLYNTMFSLFYSQACQMDTRLGGGMQLSGAFFNLGDALAVILFTPLLERCMVPAAEKLLRREVSSNMKVLTGIAIAIGSQFTAASLEYARRNAEVLPIPSNCAPLAADGQHVRMSAMSGFWMVLPYAMVGIGEVLVNPVLWHVAYTAEPSMKSLMQAFCQFAMGGLPNAISAALTQATKSWTPNDLNQGNLPMVYFVNVLFCLAGGAVYVSLTRSAGFSTDGEKEWRVAEESSEAGESDSSESIASS